MELVYLWVEDYKNIHKQGFNLSPRFECKFDEKDNALFIDINKNLIENFFAKKINVTAIVGENGSGKTSVVKFILMLIFYNQFKSLNKKEYDQCVEYKQFEAKTHLEYKNIESNHGYKGFLILSNGNKFYKISMLIDTFSNNTLRSGVHGFFNTKQIDFLEINQENINFYNIHFNYMLDTLKDGDHDEFIDTIYHKSDGYETSLLLEPYKRVDGKEQIDIGNLEYLSQQKFANIFRLKIKNQFIEKFFNPNYIKISINVQKILNKIDKLSANDQRNPLLAVIDNQNPISITNKNNLFLHTNPTDIKFKVNKLFENHDYASLNKIYIALKILEKGYHRKFENLKKIYGTFFETKGSKETIDNTIEEVKKIQSVLVDTLKEAKIPDFEIQKLINSINFESEILNVEKKKKVFSLNLNSKVDIELLSDLLTNIAPWVDIEYLEGDKSYKTLSSGEKTIFSFMINLMYQVNNLKDTKYKQINLFLDETELGLHPQWQKEYLKYIIMTLKDFDINIHLIFITHSPFILSDLAKENLIFLEKYKEEDTEVKDKIQKMGNCKNVSGEIDIQPFGANIHTLLSHGFFMKDGLMGEFAKGKINEVIKYLKNEDSEIKTDEAAENIINIIGEPVLRSTLKNMLDKKLYPNESKIEKLKRQKEEIEEAIKREENKGESNEKS